jgi:hypothetical protein
MPPTGYKPNPIMRSETDPPLKPLDNWFQLGGDKLGLKLGISVKVSGIELLLPSSWYNLKAAFATKTSVKVQNLQRDSCGKSFRLSPK